METLMAQAGEILEAVIEGMTGRTADVSPGRYNTRLVAALAVMAGEGDTLEIGCFFGASVITTALLKHAQGVRGQVYCLDPLDGRAQMPEPQFTGDTYDQRSKAHVSPGVFLANCAKFGITPRLIAKQSIPFPAELVEKQFQLAYIDGDHWHNTPQADWLNIKDRVSRYVVFDDADAKHPHVLEAVELAKQDPAWKTYHASTSIYVFERSGIHA